jgi:hypothetical protein
MHECESRCCAAASEQIDLRCQLAVKRRNHREMTTPSRQISDVPAKVDEWTHDGVRRAQRLLSRSDEDREIMLRYRPRFIMLHFIYVGTIDVNVSREKFPK